MNSPSKPAAARRLTDLAEILPDGTARLLPGVHPMEDLLELSGEELLQRFKRSQEVDFRRVIAELESPDNPLTRMFDELRAVAEQEPGNPFGQTLLFEPGGLERLFTELHDHVMAHPVWRHPFFLRIFAGEFDTEQLTRFALHYFNQVKNTRQCVALALGRFSGVMPLPYGRLNERLSELSQIVLAQLLADEYGVGSHALEDYPSLSGLFQSTTHIVMYRQLFEGLGVPFPEQDVAMLPEVADNVLTQRLVAGDRRFTALESLASVGLGMEWGVPEFFSLLLGGMIRFAAQRELPLTKRHLWVFIAHVQYDVLHAIAVMAVTSLFVRGPQEVAQVKNATNTLMAARYGMMGGLYREVFGERCPTLAEAGLEARYHLTDRRIEAALREARAEVADGTVVGADAYRRSSETPFVFAEGI